MLSKTDKTIIHHLELLKDQLFGVNGEAAYALDMLQIGFNRDLAIGTILPMQERLKLACQLIEVMVALHRLASIDEERGGAA